MRKDIGQIAWALRTSRSYSEAAERLGVSRRTLYRWLRDSRVRDALDELEEIEQAVLSARWIEAEERVIERMLGLLESTEDARVVLEVAQIILKRSSVDFGDAD